MKKIIPIFIVIFIWEFLFQFKFIDQSFFPGPISVFSQLFRLVYTDQVLTHLLISLGRLFLACLISIPLAYFLSIVSSHSIRFDNFIRPLVYLTNPLPKVAIFPLLLLIFGIADRSKIILIAIGIFYPVFITTREGMVSLLKSDLSNVVTIYKPNKYDYYFNFLYKGSLRSFLIGLSQSLNYGLTLIVVSEFSLSNNGIGNFIWKSWDQFRITDMYAGIYLLASTGLILNYLTNYFINKTLEH